MQLDKISFPAIDNLLFHNKIKNSAAMLIGMLSLSGCAGEWHEPISLLPATGSIAEFINPNDYPFYYYIMHIRGKDAGCMRVAQDITVYRYIVRNCVKQREEYFWFHYMSSYYKMCEFYGYKVPIPPRFRPVYEKVFNRPYKPNL